METNEMRSLLDFYDELKAMSFGISLISNGKIEELNQAVKNIELSMKLILSSFNK